MVYINTLLATAILSITATDALTVPPVKWTNPVYKLPVASQAKSHNNGPTPKFITYTKDQLASFPATKSAPQFTGGNTTLDKDPLSPRGIIGGSDDRVLWPSTSFPYSAIGRVAIANGICTGTLVGRRLVATARHCVPTSGSWTGRFQPSYFDEERLGGSDVVAVISTSQGSGSCWQKDDWVLLVLADGLGEERGWFGVREMNCEGERGVAKFYHMGYPGDQGAERPYRQQGISVLRCQDCAPNGPLETDADAVPGHSGGPLWLVENNVRYLYGVASQTSDQGTGFASGSALVQVINRARVDYP